MRVSRIHRLLAFFLVCTFAAAHLPVLAKPRVFQVQRKDTLLFLSDLNYFTTKANYESGGGSYTDLANGSEYSVMLLDVGAQYALTPRIYLGGEFGVANAESSLNGVGRTNSTPGELKAWGQYVAPIKVVGVVPELLFIYPFNRVETNSDDTLTGEGAMAIQPGLWLVKTFKALQFFSYLGFKYQDEDRAGLGIYRLGTQFKFNSFFVGASFNGFESLMDDKGTEIERLAVTNRVNGRSLKYYSYNPSVMEAEVWGGFNFSRTSNFKLGLAQTLNGENYAHGLTINAAFQFELFAFKPTRAPKDTSYDPKFEMENDSYDESLFEAEPPPPPRRQRRERRRPVGPSQDQLLDETMQERDKPVK